MHRHSGPTPKAGAAFCNVHRAARGSVRRLCDELQQIADSADKLKRNRGRRGLDVMQKLRTTPHADVALYDTSIRDPGLAGVDQKLVHLAHDMNARILTNDFNLNKVAQLRGVD